MGRPKKKVEPLEADADFGTPVQRALAKANRALKEAALEEVEEEVLEEEVIPESESEEEQGVLLEIPESELPSAVMGQRMAVHYVRPHFKKTKKGERTISLEISFPLTGEHEDLMPKVVREGWKFLLKRGMKKLDINEVPCHIIKLWMSHDEEKESLKLPLAGITNVSLAVIQEKGTGQSKKVIRLSFRALVNMSANVGKFAEYHFDEKLWMEWHESEEKMFEEPEEE